MLGDILHQQLQGELPRLVPVNGYQQVQDIEGVEEKMRVDLRLQHLFGQIKYEITAVLHISNFEICAFFHRKHFEIRATHIIFVSGKVDL